MTSFVVRRFIGRGPLTELSANPDGSLFHPGQVPEVCPREDLAELVAAETPLGPEQAAARLSVRRCDRGPSARALAQLACRAEPLTHELLDALPQAPPPGTVRSLLVIAGVLPERNEHLARLQRWVTSELPRLPSHQARRDRFLHPLGQGPESDRPARTARAGPPVRVTQPRTTTRMRRAVDKASPYVLPGKFPHRPSNPH
ncbi:hypothetical protein [Streptomyces flavidovirens]|uniref:hypothetical protein n=1 Tax=Streptomyces flavidovirens TaxID=67298 RepID=UPI0036B3D041